jgi:hypothetical protein
MSSAGSIPIVLTGTIVPNGIGGPQSDPGQRRAEYLEAIRFYRQFAPVYFLENSHFPLHEDSDFASAAGLYVRKFPLSSHPERGKGYQEFEMIDAWLAAEAQPPERWIKITGRYLVRNIAAVLEEWQHEPHAALLIDQTHRFTTARTHLFAVETTYYREWIQGLYRQCDDEAKQWIEYLLYRSLRTDPQRRFRVFTTQADLFALAGSSGKNMGSSPGMLALKKSLRRLNRLLDPRYLWYGSW